MINNQSFNFVKNLIAKLFTILFLGLAIAILYSLFSTAIKGVINGVDVTQIFLTSINTGVIALAVFELALVVHKEYSGNESEGNTIAGLRRTIPRFIGTVCVALSLEGLIMVIKYSQLDLAGNLFYPVAIISSTALLLSALALFIYLTKDNDDKETA